MTIIESPPRPMQEALAEPPAQSEQELIYEWFREQYWTETVFLALSDATNRRIELSDGKLVILPMPTLDHQRILKRFVNLVTAWLGADNVCAVSLSAAPP